MRSSIIPLACLIVAGCEAGPSAPEAEKARWSDPAAARSAQIRRIETEYGFTDVPEELLATESGRVLAKAVSAHGGRKAWLSLARLTYARTRKVPAEGGAQPPPVIARLSFSVDPETYLCDCRPDRHEPHIGSASAPPGADEHFLVCLPFVLMDQRLRLDYLGIEADAGSGAYYEKVRATWKDPNRSEWLLAWFERGTGLLARVLVRDAEGSLLLYVFTEWKDVRGIRFAVRRDVHNLRTLYARWDPSRPDAVEALSDLAVETAPVEER